MDVHYDGMGTRVTREWLGCPEFIRDAKAMESAYRWARRVSGKSDRKKALHADVIVTTSGMLDGGPALWYLNRLRHDGSNAILLTGYQAEGSGGRRLLETGRLPIFGNQTRIPLEIDKFELTNHADHPSIFKFARKSEPSHVVLFHADGGAAKAIEADLAVETKVHLPSNNETLEISD